MGERESKKWVVQEKKIQSKFQKLSIFGEIQVACNLSPQQIKLFEHSFIFRIRRFEISQYYEN